MDDETVARLIALNRAFYEAVAPEFSETRTHAWPGFRRVVEAMQARHPPGAPLRVLDLGAGNGRLAAFLRAVWPGPLEYLGLDSSARLLAHAAGRGLGAGFCFEQRELLDSAAIPQDGRYDLVALLGVLHHVPSRARRQRLIADAARAVARGGLLAITFWRLDRTDRLAKRALAWAAYNAASAAPIAERELEPGDHLIGWGAAGGPPRYCHFPDAAETESLLAAAGLEVCARFHADGRDDRLNEYALLTAPAES